MARKKKHPEHENLERWLISYADFITLLFATFVVLYALSQVDVSNFQKLEESIKKAFSAPSLMQGAEGLTPDSSTSILEAASPADALITPLMMEYMSQKYEAQSFNDIQKAVDEMSKTGEIDGVETEITERGLLIRFNDDLLFKPASAALTPAAKRKLDRVGATIGKKFILHQMRVEGHTDSRPLSSSMYPSNWELSSARASSIIRYFISRFSFMPSLFTAVGFADTRPLADNKTLKGQAENRRVDILILKNQFKAQETPQSEISKMDRRQQEVLQANRMNIITKIENMSDAARKLAKDNKEAEETMIMLNNVYEKEVERLNRETQARDSASKSKLTGHGSWLKPPAAEQNNATNSSKNLHSELDSKHVSESH